MLKSRERDPRGPVPPTPTGSRHVLHPTIIKNTMTRPAVAAQKQVFSKPEPDYEVVEFPTEQYVNAKLQPPPPPPPRPPTGHPVDAGSSCGLCGGGGARVRCTECGRRALCASCDDMYHRHPKRRNHQRLSLSSVQLSDERPPLPPKAAPPVPPPRRHKMSGDRLSASPRPSSADQRRNTLGHISGLAGQGIPASQFITNNHLASQQSQQQIPIHLKTKISHTPTLNHLGSMPFLPNTMPHVPIPSAQVPHIVHPNAIEHSNLSWSRQRGSLQGFHLHPNMVTQKEVWEGTETVSPTSQEWARPMQRGASLLELGGGGNMAPCPGCVQCPPNPWRYGSCATLDHSWGGWPSPFCVPPHSPAHDPRIHSHFNKHTSQTPQPYRRAENRTVSRAASRAGSRAASPAISIRSRTSRRAKHQTPSPPSLPSSDADSESESDSEHELKNKTQEKDATDARLGPAPSPPCANWQCEHCTFVNEPGVRVCVVCCRTPTTVPKVIVANVTQNVGMPKVGNNDLTSQQLCEEPREEKDKKIKYPKIKKERTSTGCGPSPPRDQIIPKSKNQYIEKNKIQTASREQTQIKYNEQPCVKHDMAVGPSPPREVQNVKHNACTETSPPKESSKTVRVSPYQNSKEMSLRETNESPRLESVLVGPSPPREINRNTVSSSSHNTINSPTVVQKKFTGTSPPREDLNDNLPKRRTNVSTTGTSPPPQTISTQTYEVPNTWERAPSTSRSRPRRRFRDDARRERSQSRHSLSSDTRESERSTRTVGANGRWDWRDSSPGAEWGEANNYNRLSRRASHLDLRRSNTHRRSGFYGSEAASPEPGATRTASLEALAKNNTQREAERGLQLAQLMSEAERLGFSAAEVQAALVQSPAAPLAWLRARWPSLCAGVRAAAARLAPQAALTELEVRAALARHRGAMWPAVTECVERHRRQNDAMSIEEGRMRGRVWGSPSGADDDAAPPRRSSRRSPRSRAEDSSDEYEAPATSTFREDDWMYLPLDVHVRENNPLTSEVSYKETFDTEEDIIFNSKYPLEDPTVPAINENLLLERLLDNTAFKTKHDMIQVHKPQQTFDLNQHVNDFIDAYNALTKSSPLPNIQANKDVKITDEINSSCDEPQPTVSSLNKINTLEQTTEGKEQIHNLRLENKHEEDYISEHDIPKKSKGKYENRTENGHRSNNIIKADMTTAANSQFIEPQISPIILENPDIISQFNVDQKKAVDDRTENLNDIVDNTQRLIQQMKEELNSDINSLDGRNISQSEFETSSNDEQESSYSDTEGRSETSYEKDTSSSEEINRKSLSKNNLISNVISIPSSEDNEQFEEALDHLENQIDEFKTSNIEILDSIARSLQEEHTISVEYKTTSRENSIAKQDLNNNLYVEVSSFEEIYAELNEKKNNHGESKVIPISVTRENQKTNSEEHEYNVPEEIINEENVKMNIGKQAIQVIAFKIANPNKLTIRELILPVENAKLELITLDDQNYLDENISNEIITNAQERDQLEMFNSGNSVQLEEDKNNIYEEKINELSITKISDDSDDDSKNIFQSTPLNCDNQDSDITLTNSEKSRSTSPASSNSNKEFTKNTENNGSNLKSPVITAPLEEKAKSTSTFHKVEPNNEREIKQETEINLTLSQANEQKNMEPKILEVIQNENNVNKNSITIKSHIPKFIKPVTNVKSKLEKTAPKLLVSKVPIRRTSIKQYPAPAPPKTHFGNVQNGHVKQLQTKLFNVKTSKPNNNPLDTTDIKPSTSSINRKKVAPLPPLQRQSPPSKTNELSPPKSSEKNQYFRETCRTEDEWTESDSECSPPPAERQKDEQENLITSPPPPITLRRVSGQLIDLATVRLPEGSPERQVRMLLAEGTTETWEQAQLAIELISRGTEQTAALIAALECADLDSALAYLHQECELCTSRLPEYEMVSMFRCTHRCCRECARHYFTVQITERSIADCVCPYCKEPELENLPDDAWLDYFAHLDILLKTLLDPEVHELFQRKLRDRTLARDPNFKWCVECSSGFFVHPKQKKLRCPECRSVTCASCRKTWSPNHEGLTCEQYAMWLDDNDPERSVAAVQQHLRENGLECPRCHFKYSLSRGGCMHFTCTQCKFEFCYGCGKPFTMGARCGLSEYCAKLGLHAHHPRNCLFYLRDKEPHELQTLLQMNNVAYETDAPEGSSGRCPIQLQRETPTGLVDGICGSEVPPNHAGLCKNHYLEYLSRSVRRHAVDPLPALRVDDLETLVRRAALRLPPRPYGSLEGLYKRALLEIVREKIPLD